MTIGKPISFTSTHSLPPNDDVTRDIGTAEIGGLDVTSELLKNGWAKVKDLKRDPTDDDTRKRELEAEAKAAGLGVWNPHGPQVCSRCPALFSLTILGTCPGTCRASHDAPRLPGICFRVEGEINRWHVFATRYFGHGLIAVDAALVEQVRDGSTLRVRLFMPDGEHQLINIALAGVRCARTSSKPDESSEPWAEEVRSPVYLLSPRPKSV
jgi:staphylococcal nuclease domain-containing protein 1